MGSDFDIVVTGRFNPNSGLDEASPSGHLDTQMFPEAKGTKFDRDVVGKNRKRHHKRRRRHVRKAEVDDLGWEVEVVSTRRFCLPVAETVQRSPTAAGRSRWSIHAVSPATVGPQGRQRQARRSKAGRGM